MLRAPLVLMSRMVASIPMSYQVDLTGSYPLAEPFSQQGGLPAFSKWLCDRVLRAKSQP